ncbi:glycoside hydrolase N-terminal domain-containing protein [Microbacterium sp. SSW1-49]|uniref:Glycoside hydrolase N-terminal domain-containing protein n=1 Tax=Microbacterium croceum TaxID=2851645 RepID=A0ABT0FHN1_9MICO|nr:glycoside hydrolase N-terminal domain-containing protein [Microbacterium croceum]MCK2037459.1 glycoside hydrolase N-terminal domain-containing protein [Microbacterium croceum]
MKSRSHFVSASTAPSWDLGMLVGSGRVGAVVWGSPDEHAISLTHERFFLPVNARTPPPRFVEAMPRIRTALLAHEAEKAAAIITETTGSADFSQMIWTDPLAPGAELRLVIDAPDEGGGAGGPVGAKPGAYRRHRNLATGEVIIAWQVDGIHRELRVSAPRGGRRVRIAVRSSAPATVRLRLGVTGDLTADIPGAASYRGFADAAVELRAPTEAALTVSAGTAGERATLTTTVSAQDATVRLVDDTGAEFAVDVEGGRWAEFEVELRHGDSDPDTLPLGDQAALHGASGLDLASGVPEDVATETLREGADGDPRMMRALIELAYAAGRANIISATGELPATLQGVWQGTWSPAWSADYTLNGNVQNGGMASLVPTGTPELTASLFRLLVPHLSDFRTNAARIFGFDGAMLPSRMSTHGLANHFSDGFPHQFWISGGGWVLRMLADAVLSSGDRELVDDETWQLIEGILLFSRDVIAHGPVAPSYSPENTPGGAATPLAVNATMDIAVLRDVDRAGRVLAEAHGRDPILLPVVEPKFRIDDDGVLAEWADPVFLPHRAHRHTSELYPLWYDMDPAFEATPMRAAARRLVQEKIAWRAEDPGPPPGNGEMAFGLAQLGLAAAALGDAPSAEQCLHWLAALHFTPAMSTTHDSGAIFNLDASGALPAVVAAMLVGSSRDAITLLPALPDSWAEGAVTGLTTRTALTVELLEWSASGIAVTLAGSAESAWVRTGPITLTLPRPVTSPAHPDPVTSIVLDHRETRHQLSLTWAPSAS